MPTSVQVRVWFITHYINLFQLVFRDLQEFIKQITESPGKLKKSQELVDSSALPAKVINFRICRKFELHIDISKDHNMKIVLGEICNIFINLPNNYFCR